MQQNCDLYRTEYLNETIKMFGTRAGCSMGVEKRSIKAEIDQSRGGHDICVHTPSRLVSLLLDVVSICKLPHLDVEF